MYKYRKNLMNSSMYTCSGYCYEEAKNESGRSMVEMLGVLAVIGVLSVAGIAGFKTAMDKHRSNELMNEASKRAVIAMAQFAQGKTVDQVSFAEFTNNEVAGATFETTAYPVGTSTNKCAIAINDVEKSICENLVNMTGGKVTMAKQSSLETPMTADQCENLNAIAFIFESDDMVACTGPNCPSSSEPFVCPSNGMYCDGNKRVSCYCPEGESCQQMVYDICPVCEQYAGNAYCLDCLDGQYRCNGNDLQYCFVDQWEYNSYCDNGCVESGSSSAYCATGGGSECSNGQYRCNGKDVEYCTGGSWTDYEPCNYGCFESDGDAYCVSGSGSECSGGQYRCDGNYVEYCNNGSWTYYENCSYGCAESGSDYAYCVSGSGSECSGGQYRCDGNYVEYCNNGSWTYYENCSYGCAESGSDYAYCATGAGNECSDGQYRCSGNYIGYCSNGYWHNNYCPSGCVESGSDYAYCR